MSLNTHTQTHTNAKSVITVHLLSIKILHGADEVIITTKQVWLPELLRPKFPDSSVWPEMIHNVGNKQAAIVWSQTALLCDTHTHTHTCIRAHTLTFDG